MHCMDTPQQRVHVASLLSSGLAEPSSTARWQAAQITEALNVLGICDSVRVVGPFRRSLSQRVAANMHDRHHTREGSPRGVTPAAMNTTASKKQFSAI